MADHSSLNRVSLLIEFLNTPQDTERSVDDYERLVEYFLEEVAMRARPAIHRALALQDSSSPEGKRKVAKWLTATLAKLRLAVAAKTGEAAFLLGLGGQSEKHGQFRLQSSRSGEGHNAWLERVDDLSALNFRPNLPRIQYQNQSQTTR